MRAARAVLIVGGLIMTAVGIVYIVYPQAWQPGPGLTLEEPAARTEIRAVYGGIELAIGLTLLYASRRPKTEWALALTLAGLVGLCAGLSRFFSLIPEGGLDWKNALWGSIEVLGGTFAFGVRRRLDDGSEAPDMPTHDTN